MDKEYLKAVLEAQMGIKNALQELHDKIGCIPTSVAFQALDVSQFDDDRTVVKIANVVIRGTL